MSVRVQVIIVVVLFFAVMASALLLVYTRHETRKEFIGLGQLHHQIAALNTEWGRLQLEQSAWSGHSRIEHIARTRLNMVLPKPGSVVFIRP